MKMYEIALNSMKQLAEMLETNEEKINQLVERMRNDNSDVCRVPGSSRLSSSSSSPTASALTSDFLEHESHKSHE